MTKLFSRSEGSRNISKFTDSKGCIVGDQHCLWSRLEECPGLWCHQNGPGLFGRRTNRAQYRQLARRSFSYRMRPNFCAKHSRVINFNFEQLFLNYYANSDRVWRIEIVWKALNVVAISRSASNKDLLKHGRRPFDENDGPVFRMWWREFVSIVAASGVWIYDFWWHISLFFSRETNFIFIYFELIPFLVTAADWSQAKQTATRRSLDDLNGMINWPSSLISTVVLQSSIKLQ